VHLCTAIVLVSAHTSGLTESQGVPGADPNHLLSVYFIGAARNGFTVHARLRSAMVYEVTEKQPSLLLRIVSYPT
jgi:hypothetical protein